MKLRTSLVLLVLPFSGCGPDSGADASDAAVRAVRVTRPLPLAPLQIEGGEDGGTGGVHGEIHFGGEVPERVLLGAAERPECCTFPEVDQRTRDLVVEEGRVSGVLVRVLDGPEPGAGGARDAPGAVLDQRGCVFLPHVVALRAGTTLEVRNADPTNHNVHALPRKNAAPRNRNMGPGQPPLHLAFPEPELDIPIRCDMHPWMRAIVHVLGHPWFDVTGADGRFQIEGLPSGRYTLEIRHAELGVLRARDVRVEAGVATGLAITF